MKRKRTLPGLLANVIDGAAALADLIIISAIPATAVSLQPQPAASATITAPAPDSRQLAELQLQMRQIAHDEVAARLTGAERGTIDIADQVMKNADETMTYLSLLMTVAILILGGLAGVGVYKEFGVVRKVRKDAETVHNTVAESRQAVERINQFDSATLAAFKEIEEYAKKLPTVELPVVMGSPFQLPDEQTVMQMEEADSLIVMGQRIRPPKEPKQFAQAFIRLAGYWRNLEDYSRAIARYQRAADLDPKCWEAYEGLAQVFSELAVRTGISPHIRNRLLAKAEECCKRAESVTGGPQVKTRARFGWIAGERDQYEKAVDLYREAQRLDTKNERPLNTYNLACIFANSLKDYPAAMEELKKLVDLLRIPEVAKLTDMTRLRELIEEDHDFDGLRIDPGCGPRLKALMDS